MFHYGTHEAHEGEKPAMPTMKAIMLKAWERYRGQCWKGDAFNRAKFARCLKEAWKVLTGAPTIIFVGEQELRELAR